MRRAWSGPASRGSTATPYSVPCSTRSRRPRPVADRARQSGFGDAALPQEHADPGDAADRRRRRDGRRLRFLPAFERRAGCTGRSPSCASSGRSPARRTSGWRSSPPPLGRARSRRTSGTNHIRFLTEPQPLRLTTDAPVIHLLEGRGFRLETLLAFLPRSGRTLCRPCRAHPGDDAARDLRTLAGLGARPRHPAGMAAGGDPRRDHAEALPA